MAITVEKWIEEIKGNERPRPLQPGEGARGGVRVSAAAVRCGRPVPPVAVALATPPRGRADRVRLVLTPPALPDPGIKSSRRHGLGLKEARTWSTGTLSRSSGRPRATRPTSSRAAGRAARPSRSSSGAVQRGQTRVVHLHKPGSGTQHACLTPIHAARCASHDHPALVRAKARPTGSSSTRGGRAKRGALVVAPMAVPSAVLAPLRRLRDAFRDLVRDSAHLDDGDPGLAHVSGSSPAAAHAALVPARTTPSLYSRCGVSAVPLKPALSPRAWHAVAGGVRDQERRDQ